MQQSNELKQKAIKGVFWSFCERFGSLFILFISNIVLARLLSPEEYGLIGMLMAFITISNIFIDGGLGSALIQKKDTYKDDYSTIFIVNIVVAIICYLVLFVCANPISNFYHRPELIPLLRVLSIIIVIDSLGTVQNTILVKTLNFKRITAIKVGVAFLSSTAAIISAICGLGVWSLAIQYIANSFFKCLLLWITTDWHPSIRFNISSFKSLFGFGSKLLLANLLSEGYRNLQVLIIGRYFPAKDVGYFSQAKQLENVPVSSVIAIVNQVTYPVFSQLQDQKETLVAGIRRCLKFLCFINFPLMVLFAVIAEPLFTLLYSTKWLSSVPYFQGLCLGFGLLLVVHNTNLNAIKSIGKSSTVLYLEIVKKIIGVSFIFCFIRVGVIGIIWALSINSFIEFFLNGYFTGKYLGYGIARQAKDILPILMVSIIAGVSVYFIPYILNLNYIVTLIIQVLLFIVIYLLVMKIVNIEIFQYVITMLKTKKIK